MAISIISDIHVKAGDQSLDCLLAFMKNKKVLSSTAIYFLGDIFDLAVGFHQEYYEDYKEFFDALETILNKGISVHYFEGNHDFHLKKLFYHFIRQKNLDKKLFNYHRNYFEEFVLGKKIFFSHGDSLGKSPLMDRIYRRIIKSFVIRFVANWMMPYSILNYVGQRASEF